MHKKQVIDLAEDPGFLGSISNSLSDAVCVVNEDLKIVYYNDEFAQVFGKPGENLTGQRFGVSIGCKGHEQFSGGICNNCRLRLSMQAALFTEVNQEKQSIVLEMESGSKEEVRLIQFQSNFMQYKGEKFAVVILNDLTGMGKETLDFINRFYEEGE